MDKKQLSDRIWYTKKARHNAEARLIRMENTISFLLAYYSVFFVTAQIFPKFVVEAASDPLDWISTASSLFLLVFSLIISGQNFKLKAEKMKGCYLELSDIEQLLEKGDNPDDVFKQFNEVLKRYDNHNTNDYDSINLWKKKDQTETSGKCFVRHLKVLASYWFFRITVIILIIFPIIAVKKYIWPFL